MSSLTKNLSSLATANTVTSTTLDQVCVVVPVFNEAGRIAAVINKLRAAGLHTILVVDDGSKDASMQEALALGAQVVRHTVNRGQGAALQTGTQWAIAHNAQWIVHFDGDDQFNAHDIAPALAFLQEQKLDVVLGTRFMDTRSSIPRFKKYVLLPLSRWINFLFTGVLLTDGQNGFRIFTKSAAEKIRITHDGMAHNLEIVAQIKKHTLRYKEFPVEVRYHRYGQGVQSGFKIIRDLLLAPWL